MFELTKIESCECIFKFGDDTQEVIILVHVGHLVIPGSEPCGINLTKKS